MSRRDPATEQLNDYSKSHSERKTLTTSLGAPISNARAVLTVGPKGPMVLQDTAFLDIMAHFDRERIPERVVHAKGSGAFGYFEVTHDITKYTKACLFSEIGKRTPIAVRFSVVTGERGSADTVRNPRGFAIKFYTEQGIFDLVGNNTPIFFVQDPLLFPMMIHTQKRNPVTDLADPDMYWDFLTLRPESTHQVVFMFSDRGIPNGYRHMHGFGSNTFKLVNAKNEPVYCKFHYKTNQGIQNLSPKVAAEIVSADPDHDRRDLYNAIASGNYPSWSFYIQVMTFEQAEKFRWNPFDVTKVWPHGEYPLIPVGQFVLDRNPTNFFADIEQLAFCVSHMVPGIEPSPDKMLQGRLFSYQDTQRHRLGPNANQLPVNRPINEVANHERDGFGTIYNQNGAPNYFPNSFGGPQECPSAAESTFHLNADVMRYDTGFEDNFGQVTLFWRKTLTAPERERLVENLVDSLKKAAGFIQERAVKVFSQVDAECGQMLREGLSKEMASSL